MNKKLKTTLEIIGIIFGSAVSAFGINELILPAHLLSGGITGICMIIYHYFGWSVGTLYFIFNIPLLILGYMHIGKRFTVYTVIAVASQSFFLNYIHLAKPLTDNSLLSSIFGGIITSVGGAIILRCNGSGGGLDVIGKVISKYKDISIGNVTMLINLVIVGVAGFIFSPEAAMSTLISLFMGTKTYEMILNHVDRITMITVTEKGEEVASALTTSMKRGVTQLEGSGAYSKKDRHVLVSVIVNAQRSTFEEIVYSVDPKAFMIILPTIAVRGKFNQITN